MLDPRGSPALLSLISAMFFGLSSSLVQKGLEHGDSKTGAMINIGTNALYYWLLAPFLMESAVWHSPAVWLFALVGLFRPFLSVNLSYAGNKRLGATITSTVNAVQPLLSILGAVLVLGEALTVPILLGTLGIIGGVVAFSWQRRGTRRDWPASALLWPLGAATVRSIANVATKSGLNMLPVPFMASLIANTVSFVMSVGQYLIEFRYVRRTMTPRGWWWFFMAGMASGVAVLTVNSALVQGDVVIVVPVNNSAPLFTLLFSWLVFRQERLTFRILLGLLLILPSVIL
ncbi:MAG: DMT family transporter, partial [Candidatus Lambdaproteobacteria bacterium]|nr:DMT family transporter [Candidatus Lambdaproteobacteria bacterium]